MAANRTKFQREKDLADTARLYLQGKAQMEIAETVGVDASTICRDIKTLQKRWMEQANIDFDTARAEQLARIDELERTYWEAWRNSLTRETTTSKKKEGTAQGMEASVRRESRDGNPAYLDGVFRCIDRRCKLLGLDAPAKVGVGGMDGGPIRYEHTDVDSELGRLMAGVGRETEACSARQGYELPPGFGSPN